VEKGREEKEKGGEGEEKDLEINFWLWPCVKFCKLTVNGLIV